MTIPTPDEICERLLRWASAHATSNCAMAYDLREAADLIQQQRATIERLSAALECLCFAVHGLIVATDGCEELRDKRQAALDAMKNAVAALGKDAK